MAILRPKTYNTDMKRKRNNYETHRRSIVKSVVFRVVVITSDTTIIFLLTHKIAETLGLTVATNLSSATLYYLYERIWNRVKWGRA